MTEGIYYSGQGQETPIFCEHVACPPINNELLLCAGNSPHVTASLPPTPVAPPVSNQVIVPKS